MEGRSVVLFHEVFVEEFVLLGDGFLALGDFEGFTGGEVFLERIDHVHLTIVGFLGHFEGVPFTNVDNFFAVVEVVIFEFEEVHQVIRFGF